MRQIKQQIIDVVIPAHEKDIDTLNHCIDGVKKNMDVRRIIVVSKEKYTDKAEWFDESLFPFSYQEVGGLIKNGSIGWHFQQMLKLYSPLIIPDIAPNVLVIDSDTVFLKKVKFFSEAGLPFYNVAKDTDLENSTFHQVSYKHIIKILPEIGENLPEKFKNISGICHHMLFQKHVIEELFARVESHDEVGDPFYKVFLKNAQTSCGVAEYNLYFYFLVALHPQDYEIRILKYKNTADFNLWKYRWRSKYDYCSFHSYMREGQENSLKKIAKSFLKKISRIFYFDHWEIGVIDFPIHEMLRITPTVSWIKNPDKLTFFADPFGIEVGAKKFIVFEDYSQIKKRGRIAIAEFDATSATLKKKQIILDDGKHLSYPCLIKHEGEFFMICESYKAQKLSLYKIDLESLSATKVKDIFAGKKIVDSTIFYHQNKFWIFYTLAAGASDANLHIASSDSLFGEFKEHPKNPVKNDVFSARSAGTPFLFDGEIYRPSQNCTKSYGSSIVINRITELSEENFKEEFVREIKPRAQSFCCEGMHTLSSFGNLTLIDGKRKVFIFYKPLISLIRNLVRIFK